MVEKVIIKEGMRFLIYLEGEMIKDLDGTNLEMLEIPKGWVEVIAVQEKICTAVSYKTKIKRKHILDSLMLYRDIEERVKLADVPDSLSPPDEVKIGDLVRQIIQ